MYSWITSMILRKTSVKEQQSVLKRTASTRVLAPSAVP